jgi:hypothetical protein
MNHKEFIEQEIARLEREFQRIMTGEEDTKEKQKHLNDIRDSLKNLRRLKNSVPSNA